MLNLTIFAGHRSEYCLILGLPLVDRVSVQSVSEAGERIHARAETCRIFPTLLRLYGIPASQRPSAASFRLRLPRMVASGPAVVCLAERAP